MVISGNVKKEVMASDWYAEGEGMGCRMMSTLLGRKNLKAKLLATFQISYFLVEKIPEKKELILT